MEQPSIFSATLGLSAPWQITAIKLANDGQQLDISIGFTGSHSFCCPACGRQAKPSSSKNETWHHSNFFKYNAFLHARVPVVECNHGCGCRKLDVPWERSGSKFVLLSS